MYQEIIEEKIAECLKNGKKVELAVWRSIKAEFQSFKTAKENVGKTLNDAVELKLIQKLANQRLDAAEQYKEAASTYTDSEKKAVAEVNYAKENAEYEVLMTLLPKEPTVDELKAVIKEAITEVEMMTGAPVSMKNMGAIQSFVRQKFPTANGGTIADIVKKTILGR